MTIILLIVCSLLCAVWVMIYGYLAWSLKHLPRFRDEVAAIPSTTNQLPKLSVIIPACNEAGHIESAVKSLLSQDYPGLEIIVVNDRSTDTTGDILNQLAGQDDRLHVIHIDSLPSRWLGKVHAMHQGVQQAKGEWLLFTDADVHFAPRVLRDAMGLVQHYQIDHLALLPEPLCNDFWLEVAVRTFGLLFLLTTRAVSVNKPGSKQYMGIGGFNLVSARMFQRTPGFEWLRLEPADDVGLGMMVKQAGGRTRFALAEKDVTVTWYPTLRAMFNGLEKNLFGPGASYQWWRMLLLVGTIWALLAAPVMALVMGISQDSVILLTGGGTVVFIHVIFSIFFAGKRRSDSMILLALPIGLIIFSIMLLHAGYQCLKNNGIDWRGTHYPLDQLRTGQRIKF